MWQQMCDVCLGAINVTLQTDYVELCWLMREIDVTAGV
jgi:hypothetical protein